MKPFIAALFLLGLLTACNLPPAPLEDTQLAPLTLQWPRSLSQAANKAVVQVYQGETLLQTLSLSSGNLSQTLQLPNRKTYRLESSFLKDDLELAWGKQTQNLDGPNTAVLEAKPIVAKLELSPAGFDFETNRLRFGLQVIAQGDSALSENQFDPPTYTVSGGTLAQLSSSGVEVIPDDSADSVRVEASLVGLNKQHTESKLSTSLSVGRDSFTSYSQWLSRFNYSIQNWNLVANPNGYKVELIVTKPDLSIAVLSSSPVNANGTFQVRLPEQTELEQRGFLQANTYLKTDSFGKVETSSFLGTQASLRLVSPTGGYSDFAFSPNAPTATSNAINPATSYSDFGLFFVFTTAPFAFDSVTGMYVVHETALHLRVGWNLVSSASDYSYGPGRSSGYDRFISIASNTAKSAIEHSLYAYLDSISLSTEGSGRLNVLPNQPFTVFLGLKQSGVFYGNTQRYVRIQMQLPPGVQPTKTSGIQNSDSYAYTNKCQWQQSPTDEQRIDIACELFDQKSHLLGIELSASQLTKEETVQYRIEDDWHLDLEPSDNKAAFMLVAPSRFTAAPLTLEPTLSNLPQGVSGLTLEVLDDRQQVVSSAPVTSDGHVRFTLPATMNELSPQASGLVCGFPETSKVVAQSVHLRLKDANSNSYIIEFDRPYYSPYATKELYFVMANQPVAYVRNCTQDPLNRYTRSADINLEAGWNLAVYDWNGGPGGGGHTDSYSLSFADALSKEWKILKIEQ